MRIENIFDYDDNQNNDLLRTLGRLKAQEAEDLILGESQCWLYQIFWFSSDYTQKTVSDFLGGKSSEIKQDLWQN